MARPCRAGRTPAYAAAYGTALGDRDLHGMEERPPIAAAGIAVAKAAEKMASAVGSGHAPLSPAITNEKGYWPVAAPMRSAICRLRGGAISRALPGRARTAVAATPRAVRRFARRSGRRTRSPRPP